MEHCGCSSLPPFNHRLQWHPSSSGALDEAGQSGGATGAGSRPVGASRKAEDPTSMAVLAMEVALGFLFKVHYLL